MKNITFLSILFLASLITISKALVIKRDEGEELSPDYFINRAKLVRDENAEDEKKRCGEIGGDVYYYAYEDKTSFFFDAVLCLKRTEDDRFEILDYEGMGDVLCDAGDVLNEDYIDSCFNPTATVEHLEIEDKPVHVEKRDEGEELSPDYFINRAKLVRDENAEDEKKRCGEIGGDVYYYAYEDKTSFFFDAVLCLKRTEDDRFEILDYEGMGDVLCDAGDVLNEDYIDSCFNPTATVEHLEIEN